MQQIVNALIKYKKFILFFSLLCFAFIFIFNRSIYHKSKFNRFFINSIGRVSNFSFTINEYFNLKKINDKILKENKTLKNLQINRSNFKIEDTKDFQFEVFSAKIIKNSLKSSRNYLIVNKGIKDSIEAEMGVISSNGVIGIVNTVSENYSSVISILNTDLKLNAKFKKNNAFGSLSWNSINPSIIQFNDISVINKISIGDSIVTGGMSTYFPEGILIGKIIRYKSYDGKGYYEIDVELNNKIGKEINVYILKNNHQKEINNLE